MAIKLKDILEGTSNFSTDGEPDTGFIRGGKTRKLGKLEGKPEPWFEGGQYTQVEFPEADYMLGKGVDSGFTVVKTINETSKLKDILEADSRTARKKGQKRKSSKHSDLYTDEDPKGTIKGLGFKDATTAKKGIGIINKAKRPHAHKVQATLVMQQRAKVAKERAKDPEKKKNLSAAYKIWTAKLEQLKRKTKNA